jgi:hypothetical protein
MRNIGSWMEWFGEMGMVVLGANNNYLINKSYKEDR